MGLCVHSSPVAPLNKTTHYYPALDGLRAVAILLVIFSHAGFEQYVPGSLGVTLFFVISGFLLTQQMIGEIQQTGTLDIKKFYIRRALRLFPALAFYLLLICGALAILGVIVSLPQILSGLFYFANYYHIFIGYPAHNPLPILWSLSVEEHFYILFPLILIAFRKNAAGLFPWLLIAVTAALVWRIILYTSCPNSNWALCGLPGKERYFGTDAIFDCILYGCVAALALQYWSNKVRQFAVNQTSFWMALALLFTSLIYRDEFFRQTLRFTIQSASIAILILNILYGDFLKLQRTLSYEPLRVIGRASYSLYLFHYGALALVNTVTGHEGSGLSSAAALLAYFLLTILLSTTSYQLIEKPMIKLRRQYGSHTQI